MTILSDNIRKYRKLRGMTQVELSLKLGNSGNSSVSDWERGLYEPNTTSLFKLAKVFGISVYDLMEEKDEA